MLCRFASRRNYLNRGIRLKTTDTLRIPSRATIMQGLMSGEEFDLLIIGAGATGSGMFYYVYILFIMFPNVFIVLD